MRPFNCNLLSVASASGATGATESSGASASRTAHIVAVKGAETPCERENYVASQSIVDNFAVIVGVVGNAEVLGLAEYVVALEGKGNSFLEKQFLDFGFSFRISASVSGFQFQDYCFNPLQSCHFLSCTSPVRVLH